MIKNIQAAALMLFALFMASCESFYYTEEAEDNSEKNVHINVTEIKQTAFNEDEKDVLSLGSALRGVVSTAPLL